MGPNVGNGMGGTEMGLGMHPHCATNQPPATEYTLQGVMRFLQTEWHRHERDRNAWEIEKQEMRSRIASLEGQARRADATQKALKKYVSILERKIKEQAAQLNGTPLKDAAAATAKGDRATRVQEKLQCQSNPPPSLLPGAWRAHSLTPRPASPEGLSAPGADDAMQAPKLDDDAQRNDLKTFLDQCQAEFMYLMVTPANPPPPRDSPPLPMMEDLREVEAFGMPGHQPVERQYPVQRSAPNHGSDVNVMGSRAHQGPGSAPQIQQAPQGFAGKADLQSRPMVRAAHEQQQQQQQQQQSSIFAGPNDWDSPVLVTTHALDEGVGVPDPGHAVEVLGGAADSAGPREKPATVSDADGWEFPEGAFPEPGSTQQLPAASASAANRPDTDVFPNADYLPKSPNRGPGGHRRKSSMSRRRSAEHALALHAAPSRADGSTFKLRFGLRGHLDTVRTVIFSGGGSPGEPEICTAGDDGMIKRFHVPRLDGHAGPAAAASDLDVIANFTHRGHTGSVLSLTSWSPSPSFSTGGRAQGDGWIFSGGQDATIRVWERGRVDPKATLEGHTDAVWALCVLPPPSAASLAARATTAVRTAYCSCPARPTARCGCGPSARRPSSARRSRARTGACPGAAAACAATR